METRYKSGWPRLHRSHRFNGSACTALRDCVDLITVYACKLPGHKIMFGDALVLKPERFHSANALVRCEPFPFLIASDTLAQTKRSALDQDFPKYDEAGFLPYSDSECGPAVIGLVSEATSPAFADTLGEQLGIKRLSQYPTLVTICRFLDRRHGAIHTDGEAKIATALFYLNDTWGPTSGGCLRFLNSQNDIDDS